MVSVYDNKIPVPVIPNLKTKAQKVLEYEKDAGIARGFDKIDSGVYVLNRLLVEAQTSVRFMLADLWAPLIKTGRMGAFDVQERFYDIGTVERLKEFEEKVRDYFPHPISC
jgi:NDP-sugar pyrophosphorylase family protein